MARIKRDDLERLHDYDVYVPKRTIYIGSGQMGESEGDDSETGVDGALAQRVIKNLLALDAEPYDPITIILNCIGGDAYHGLAIYDAIKACKSHVTIKVFGQASSMGSVILQAGDDRIMSPSSRQLMHYGETSLRGEAKSVQTGAKEDERISKLMESIYLDRISTKHPEFKLKKLKELLSVDTWLSSKESIELGLADSILGEE